MKKIHVPAYATRMTDTLRCRRCDSNEDVQECDMKNVIYVGELCWPCREQLIDMIRAWQDTQCNCAIETGDYESLRKRCPVHRSV